MSSGSLFLSLETRRWHKLVKAARHNRRAIPAELGAGSNISPSRSHLNFTIEGPPTHEEIPESAKTLIMAAGAWPLRSNGVACIEAVFSLPIGSHIDPHVYFGECTEWVRRRFACPVLSSDVHLDESAAHCHVLFLPLVDGRMQGSDVLGNRSKFNAHLDSFFAEVARSFGLRRSPRLTAQHRRRIAADVVGKLMQLQDPTISGIVWSNVRASIEADPVPYAEALGISTAPPAKKLRGFTDTMISRGKGPRYERPSGSPIGVSGAAVPRPVGSNSYPV